jgi:vancomycin permeability regulator SanA
MEDASQTKNFPDAKLHKTFAHFVRQRWKIELLLALLLAVLLWGPTIYANLSTRHERYDMSKVSVHDIPKRNVAIVFGAGVLPDGTPTPYLKWRVQTAVELYKAHRVQKILMTGDNSSKHYNEPVAMGKLAEQQGVPATDIVLDYAGLNTYDSCYRARAIFKVKSAILVSQGYHLPRAVMTCNRLGMQSIGVDAVHSGRDFTVSYIAREWVSTDKAIVQLIFKPNPTVLGPSQPINIAQ